MASTVHNKLEIISTCIYILTTLMEDKILKNLTSLMVSYLHKELTKYHSPIFNTIESRILLVTIQTF